MSGGGGRTAIENTLRAEARHVLAALVRRYGRFDAAEDAVQEALLAAATQWAADGVPERPRGWLLRVAARRMTDQFRSEDASRRREELVYSRTPADELHAPAADDVVLPGDDRGATGDDTLTLLMLCCHPQLTPPSRIALTLRAVGGLTTAEIARAFLVPESTMGQRISRAKASIKAAGARFEPPPEADRDEWMRSVLHVLYLIFNEGYTATAGAELARVALTAEAIRLTRLVRASRPDDGEVAGLLALMLLTDARRPARTDDAGALVPLADQDRGRWDGPSMREGLALIGATLPHSVIGPYQIQAAIAAVHAEAERAEDTDWPQIVVLYEMLIDLSPSPAASLGQAVAVAMVDGPRAGLALVERLSDTGQLSEHHRLAAVRAHLLEKAGDHLAAVAEYRTAAKLTTSIPERNYLRSRADRLAVTVAGELPRPSADGDR